MRIVLWAVFIGILAIMWGREFIVLGEARREGAATAFDFRRFRRRSLGLLLLLLLGIGMDLSTWLQWDTPWQAIGFYGIFLIFFIWLLIVAARDLRATVLSFERERQGVTLQALEEMRRTVSRRESRDEYDPIPLIDFTGRPRYGSSAHVRKPDLSGDPSVSDPASSVPSSIEASPEEEAGEHRR